MKRKTSAAAQQPFKKPRLTRAQEQQVLDVVMADAFPARQISRYNNTVGLEELKFFDSTVGSAANTTPVILPLNEVPTGDDALSRDGNKIMCRSLELRLKASLKAITQNATIRMLLVHDKNENGTVLTATQLLTANTPEAFTLINNKSRFTLLWDKTFVLNQSASNAGGFQQWFQKKYVKIPKDLQLTQYPSGATNVPISGGLVFVYFSNVAAGATDVNFTVNSRLRFVG